MRRLQKDTSGQFKRYIAYNAHGDTLQLYAEDLEAGVQKVVDLAEDIAWGPIEYFEMPDDKDIWQTQWGPIEDVEDLGIKVNDERSE